MTQRSALCMDTKACGHKDCIIVNTTESVSDTSLLLVEFPEICFQVLQLLPDQTDPDIQHQRSWQKPGPQLGERDW